MGGLNVRELLKNTYSKLCDKHNAQEVVLPERTLAEIANDSDWHRTRVGYMGYNVANLLELNGKTWAIAKGEACGSYPAEPYDSDILALELKVTRLTEGKPKKKTNEEIQEELIRGIRGSSYFQNSIIYGMADGMLAVNKKGRFGSKMLDLLQPQIQGFIAQKPEYDKSVILASTLRYPTTKVMLYKAEFVDFLVDSIEAVLK